MHKILKHKKIILAAILPFGFWVVVFYFWLSTSKQYAVPQPIINKTKIQNKTGLANINQLASANSYTDTDHDGLSDWEESVYSTDPKNSDTDGDKYLDGEEIASNRNPLVAGPNDLVSKSSIPTNNNQTATEKLTQLATNNYMQALQGKDPSSMNPEQLNQILSESFNDPKSSSDIKEILKSELYYFTPPDLESDKKISATQSTKKDAEKYMAQLEDLMITLDKNKPSKDIVDAINTSMQTKQYQILNQHSVYYKNLYETSKNMAVVSQFLEDHRNLVTMFYKYWKISEAIENYEQDPVRGSLALNELANLIQKSSNQP